jgi:hypothetical protein
MNPLLVVAIPLVLVVIGMILNSVGLAYDQPPSSPEQDPLKRATAEKESYRKFFDLQRSRSLKRQKRVSQYCWLLLITFIGAFIWMYLDAVNKTAASTQVASMQTLATEEGKQMVLSMTLNDGSNVKYLIKLPERKPEAAQVDKSVDGVAPQVSIEKISSWELERLGTALSIGENPLPLGFVSLKEPAEDVGNADPRALQLCLNAWEAQERLGSPEGELALAQAVCYLAAAPKSNAVYQAFKAAMKDAAGQGSLEVPVHLRNAPTRLMKELGYGREYRYAHDEPEAYAAGETYFPEGMKPRRYYRPVPRGLEIRIGEKFERLREMDKEYLKKQKDKNKS